MKGYIYYRIVPEVVFETTQTITQAVVQVGQLAIFSAGM
jgi:hypothetical protein